MSESVLRVLITGAGAPGIRGTLYALRHNPEAKHIYTVGTDMSPDVVGRFLVDRFYQVPAPEGQSYKETLLDLCIKESIEVVVPQTTRESFVLSGFRNEFLQEGIRILVSDFPAMEVANDKWRILQAFERLNLPHPAYHLARTEAELAEFASHLGYPERPVVVKPAVSNGMRGLRILKERAWDVRRFLVDKPNGVEISLPELLTILKRGDTWPELLITEYLPGPEYSVDAFVGEYTRIAIPRQRQSIRSGISFQNLLEFRTDMSEYTIQAGAHIGLRYAFGFQFALDAQGIPKVLECNPRVQGTMVASIFSGANVIWMAVRELLGNPPTTTLGSLQPAAFYRFWGGIGVVNGQTDEI